MHIPMQINTFYKLIKNRMMIIVFKIKKFQINKIVNIKFKMILIIRLKCKLL
jgi:hypothetical protein